MTSRDKHEDDEHEIKGFFSRWSERKRAAEDDAARPETASEPDAAAPAAAEEVQPVDPADLPDIDSLDASSDFTVFMRPGVPAALKQRALRRLWQVDPAFKHICMLDDYNLDYTDAATVVPNLKTVYQVGRGMVLDDAAEEEATPEAPTRQVAAQHAPQPGEAEARTSEVDAESQAESPASDGETTQEPDAGSHAADAESAPRRPAAADEPQSVVRSARRRRWGDFEAT